MMQYHCQTHPLLAMQLNGNLNKPAAMGTNESPTRVWGSGESQATGEPTAVLHGDLSRFDAPSTQPTARSEAETRVWGRGDSQATGEPTAVLPGDLPRFDPGQSSRNREGEQEESPFAAGAFWRLRPSYLA